MTELLFLENASQEVLDRLHIVLGCGFDFRKRCHVFLREIAHPLAQRLLLGIAQRSGVGDTVVGEGDEPLDFHF